jgi:hypothetical protein
VKVCVAASGGAQVKGKDRMKLSLPPKVIIFPTRERESTSFFLQYAENFAKHFKFGFKLHYYYNNL